MSKQIKKIVAELCQIEPLFIGREEEISKLVEKLLASKPDAKINRKFVAALRSQLMQMAQGKVELPAKKNKFNFMNKYQFVGVGALAVLIMALVVFTGTNFSSTTVTVADFGAPHFSNMNRSAFGDLSLADGSLTAPNAASAEGKAIGMGGGGGGGTAGSSMIAYPNDEITLFRYVYKGDQPSVDAESLPVYKRTSKNLSSGVNGVIKNLGLGLINTKNFTNATVRNINFIDRSGENWNVYVDFDQGAISIYREMPYEASPMPYQPITQDQILPDDQLMALANQAVKKFGIDVQAYGDPKVMDDWKIFYEMAEDKSNYYFPEYMNVIYPQLIKGKQAVEQSGFSDGLSVTIDIRKKQVNSISNIAVQTFQQSDYKIESNISTLVDNYSTRTQSWGYPDNVSKRYVDVELGTPEFVLAKIYRWDTGTPEQLYAPALMFPVTNELPEFPYMQKNIVIPLVEDIYTYY